MTFFPTIPLPGAPKMSDEDRAKLADGPKVVMVFPRDVTLTLVHGHSVHFKKGINEVPQSLAGDEKGVGMHWFLAGHGVKRQPAGLPAVIAQPKPTDAHTAEEPADVEQSADANADDGVGREAEDNGADATPDKPRRGRPPKE